MTEPTLTEENIDSLISIHHPLITKALETKEQVQELKQKILQGQKLIQLMEEELKKCDEDYNRYEEPVGWQNVPITGQIESLLQSLLDKSKGDKE